MKVETEGVSSSRRSATVVAWLLPHLLAYVAAQGYDATPLRRLPGIRGRDVDDPDVRVTAAAAAEAWRVAEEILGDDAVGLHMAEAIPRGALDLLEYALRSSPTLEAALEQLARYGRVVSETAAVRIAREGHAVTVTLGGHPHPHGSEFTSAFLVRVAREETGTALAPVEVRFTHRCPDAPFDHRSFFRAPLRFEEPSNQLLFASSDAARLFRSADSGLETVTCRRLDKMLAQIPSEDESTAALVRRALLGTLARGDPSAAAMARALALSVRTLHRRLRAEGTSFRGVIDAVRLELATQLLRERSVGISEVAFVLGYSEPAAFHRSFRRWTGQTPRAFRRAVRSA